MLHVLLAAALGYLFGSIPAAYLLVWWRSRKDIRRTGSGNVGALNSYLVTRSRLVGISVLLCDLLKGVLAVLAARVLDEGGCLACAVAGVAAVLGHVFPVWLKFRGGRGLATAAGVFLVLGWPVVPVWSLLWGLGYVLSRNVNVGNAIASLLLFLLSIAAPPWSVEWAGAGGLPVEGLRVVVAVLMVVILARLVAPVREFIQGSAAADPGYGADAELEKENS